MTSSNDDAQHVLPAMSLLASLSTAAEVRHGMAERRAGRDPAAQEETEVARPFLQEARRELHELLLRLRTGLAYEEDHPERETVAAVRHFDRLMTLNRVARLLHVMHQRLLSLYPDVAEERLEEVRLLETRAKALLEESGDLFSQHLSHFLEDALLLAVKLKYEA